MRLEFGLCVLQFIILLGTDGVSENASNKLEPHQSLEDFVEDVGNITTELPVVLVEHQQGSYRSDDSLNDGIGAEEHRYDEDEDDGEEEEDNGTSLDDQNLAKGTESDSNDEDSIKFLLFSDPNNPDKFERTEPEKNNSLRTSSFDPKKPIKILIHGFRGKHNSTFPRNVKEAYLERKSEFDYNIFIVDWRLLALPSQKSTIRTYPRAVRNVQKVADRVASFITWLRKDFNVNLDHVHIIGHSLGAHVAGNAGDSLIQQHGLAIGRITGLDPAGPEFYPKIQRTRRLHSTDAQYVDVIHTNGGMLGIYKNIGSADFWVNPGAGPQPGCGSVSSRQELTQLVSGSCSHRMATIFFASTIRRREDYERCACSSRMKFSFGKKCCDRMVIFGEFSPAGTRGTFYMSYKIQNDTLKSESHGSSTGKGGMKKIWNAVRRWFST